MSSKASKNYPPARSATGQDSWTRLRLGDICGIVRGVSYKKDQASQQPGKGKVPILRATNIQDSTLVLDSELVYVPSAVVSEEQMLQVGDIVVATSSGSKHLVGKTAQVKNLWEGSFGAFCATLRPKVDIDHRYLGYFLGSREYKDYISKKALGVNINNLRRGDLEEISVPVAPPEQQKHIVAEIEKQFSRLDEAVANLKRIKANLKRYKAAVLKTAVEGKLTEAWRKAHPNVEPASKLLARILTERRTKWVGKGKYKEPGKPDSSNLPELPQHWVWCLTDALFSFVTSGSRGWAQYYSDDGPLFLRMGNLDHESIRLDLGDVQRVKPPAGTEGMRTKVETGDILISITADVGMIAVVPARLGDAYINQHVSLARPLNGFCREYLAWYLASHDGGQKMFLQLQRGATKVGLGLDDIRAVPVPFPPLAEQQEILAEIERRLSFIERLEAAVDANLTRAVRLRQSVLEKAFSGRLVPEDPNAEPAAVLFSRPNDEHRVAVDKTTPGQKTFVIPEKEAMMADLIEALRSSGGWLAAQEAFRLHGIADGADTNEVERVYAELRECIHLGQIEVERRGEQDWLRLVESKGG